MALKKSPLKSAIAICFAALIVLASAGLIVSAVTRTAQVVPSKGQLMVFNVAVYSNSACTQIATNVDWGSLNGGGTANATVWIKNTGNSNVKLNMTAVNWSPANASLWMTLTWNQEGKTLAPAQVVQANLVLTVNASVDVNISDFAFNIVISGTT